MLKLLYFFCLSLLLFSCNDLSDEELETRLAELQLIELANEHLQEDIDKYKWNIDANIAGAQSRYAKENAKFHANKIWKIDSIIFVQIDSNSNSNSFDLLAMEKSISSIKGDIFKLIEKDTLEYALFDGNQYFDSSFNYRYTNFYEDVNDIEKQTSNLFKAVKNPNELELKEINTLLTSQLLLLNKKSIKYLSQYIYIKKGNITNDELFNSLNISKTRFKPNELFTFDIYTSVSYLTNHSILHYRLDDSITYKNYSFNEFKLEAIELPTNKLGKHKVEIKQYQSKRKTQEYTFDYEVIENK